MKLTNNEIYQAAMSLSNFHIEGKLPVKINFFLQKNIQALVAAGQEIEEARINIAREYGELDETNQSYHVPAEKMEEAAAELNDLFNLSQELNIHTFKIDDFDGINLSYEQLASIIFMIEE